MSERPTPSDPPNEEDLEVVERARTKHPRRYQVVLHNDDYTTMEFVVEVLMRFFRKDITQARHIMLHVHHKGYGIVDTFPRDIAETKAEQVIPCAAPPSPSRKKARMGTDVVGTSVAAPRRSAPRRSPAPAFRIGRAVDGGFGLPQGMYLPSIG
jgi:ATP-dependent Clp protease adaptor protein ClpS